MLIPPKQKTGMASASCTAATSCKQMASMGGSLRIDEERAEGHVIRAALEQPLRGHRSRFRRKMVLRIDNAIELGVLER